MKSKILISDDSRSQSASKIIITVVTSTVPFSNEHRSPKRANVEEERKASNDFATMICNLF